jgi:hypothetical protein
MCFAAKAKLLCEGCHSSLCKTCAQFVDENRFAFFQETGEDQLIGTYCASCFDKTVVPVAAAYDELMDKAKSLFVYYTEDGKLTRLIKRSDTSFKITTCTDREETILRLAFLAARAGFNAIMDVDVWFEKTREGSFKFLNWVGTGTAAQLEPKKLGK